jgi:hypothetical protein
MVVQKYMPGAHEPSPGPPLTRDGGGPAAERPAHPAHHGTDTRSLMMSMSAAMVGVCLTVVSVYKLLVKQNDLSHFVDDLMTLDALLFLASCFFAFCALKMSPGRRRVRFELGADALFFIALALMAVVCALITYSIV